MADPVSGTFDFDSNTVSLQGGVPFFGFPWDSSGDLVDQGNGTYSSSQTAYWGTSSLSWAILWEITQNRNTATVVTQPSTTGYEVNGTLTAVPLPAAGWLLGSGLVGLIGVAGRKTRSSYVKGSE